jgi:hypothetical protein
VLTDVVELIVIGPFFFFLCVPPIFALAYKSSVFVIHAVVAPESGVSTSATAALGNESGVVNASNSEHALVAGVELLRQHAFNVIFKRHPSFSQLYLATCKLEILTLQVLVGYFSIVYEIRIVVFDHLRNVSELVLREILRVSWR